MAIYLYFELSILRVCLCYLSVKVSLNNLLMYYLNKRRLDALNAIECILMCIQNVGSITTNRSKRGNT